jgi:hypothetical protein
MVVVAGVPKKVKVHARCTASSSPRFGMYISFVEWHIQFCKVWPYHYCTYECHEVCIDFVGSSSRADDSSHACGVRPVIAFGTCLDTLIFPLSTSS